MEISTLGKLHREKGTVIYSTMLRHSAGLTVTTARVSLFLKCEGISACQSGAGR